MQRAGAALAALLLIGLVWTPAAGAAEEGPASTVTGHGWGHGRGMGQYGSQGYALEGWTSAQILAHFYQGTSPGNVADLDAELNPLAGDPDALRVELRGNRNQAVRVELGEGVMTIVDAVTGVRLTDIGGNPLADQEQVVRVYSNGAEVVVQRAATCSGNAGGAWDTIASAPASGIEILPVPSEGASTLGSLLRVCEPDGESTWYEGTIRAHNIEGSTRVVNVVPLDSYLRGVVPKEVPASWEPAALQSQAVAARSYVVAGDSRQQPYADTCDTTLCQVYGGRFHANDQPPAHLGPAERTDHDATNAAIQATTGVIRLMADGSVARTEFSSSTGGYTAGGDFAAVEDLGDSTPSNPNHDWTKVVDLSGFEASAGLGRLLDIVETGNGLGDEIGRVLEVEFVFEEGSITRTGNQVRQTFGLKSDWFDFGPVGGCADGEGEHYIERVHQVFLGRSASVAEVCEWIDEVGAQQRYLLTESLVVSPEWAGVMIDDLYRSALGREPDPSGRAHWLGQIASGVRLERIGAEFYGSPEYYRLAGGTHEAFVEQLYLDVQERPAEAEGLEFWVGRLQSGQAVPQTVAASFYASIESRERRVVQLYQQVLGRNPEAAGLAYWSDRLLSTDDVRLASFLAASEESLRLSQP